MNKIKWYYDVSDRYGWILSRNEALWLTSKIGDPAVTFSVYRYFKVHVPDYMGLIYNVS